MRSLVASHSPYARIYSCSTSSYQTQRVVSRRSHCLHPTVSRPSPIENQKPFTKRKRKPCIIAENLSKRGMSHATILGIVKFSIGMCAHAKLFCEARMPSHRREKSIVRQRPNQLFRGLGLLCFVCVLRALFAFCRCCYSRHDSNNFRNSLLHCSKLLHFARHDSGCWLT